MVRGLTVVRVLKTDGSLVDRADVPMQNDFSVPASILDEVSKTDDIIANVSSLNDRDYIEAILKLQRGGDEILYVVRQISPQIAQHLRATQAGLFEYQALQSRRLGLQIAFAQMFALIALILVTLSAVYLGLSLRQPPGARRSAGSSAPRTRSRRATSMSQVHICSDRGRPRPISATPSTR
jgi:two-component system nitrogen regulation sensor histidine kinase NtrY